MMSNGETGLENEDNSSIILIISGRIGSYTLKYMSSFPDQHDMRFWQERKIIKTLNNSRKNTVPS